MTVRPRLVRSGPFWLLLVGSLASLGYGGWLVLDKIATMTATLADGSATGIEVYAGQSWVMVGGAFLLAGLIGLGTILALAVARSFVALAAPVASAELDAPADLDAPVDDDLTADDLGYDPQLGYTETPSPDASPAERVSDELPETVSSGR